MKNRKFISKEGFECIGWDIQTYTSKIFETGPQFWAEFSYSNGYHQFSFDLDTATTLYQELGKFLSIATKKESEFKLSQKKAKK
jgi:hypothetical protein